ncbi:hypothetical protein C0Q70_17041 [Pomacea canaliculata]|uniref:Uncharacterized protein n=1 Tax=Pomacea canaliculata TaxID=400727 RepID=A0A2T7NRH4_POMCA|nr:hypothetical protein C0Q70_17041 [Pomacea canaliculata]
MLLPELLPLLSCSCSQHVGYLRAGVNTARCSQHVPPHLRREKSANDDSRAAGGDEDSWAGDSQPSSSWLQQAEVPTSLDKQPDIWESQSLGWKIPPSSQARLPTRQAATGVSRGSLVGLLISCYGPHPPERPLTPALPSSLPHSHTHRTPEQHVLFPRPSFLGAVVMMGESRGPYNLVCRVVGQIVMD